VKGKASLGIDFRGGALVHVELQDGKKISEAEVLAAAKDLKLPDGKDVGSVYAQEKTSQFGQVWGVRCEFDAGPVVEKAILSKLGKEAVKGTRVERVGSVIGSEMAKTSLIALVVALLAIFVYLMFRFEFAFALGAIVALFHDVLMVPGLCVLFGQELSVIHVGALLTIAGYSINDTIVVFDRIREVIQSGQKESMRSLMNEAICKTLSRTLLTGPTALAPMVALLFMGNPAMIEFALPIVIGVVLGTYSSIFIASPLVLWYAERSGTSIEQEVLEAHERKQKMEAALRQAETQAKI
jgi:SecD/SecF fusion protein